LRPEPDRFQEYSTVASAMIAIRAGRDQRGAFSGGPDCVSGGPDRAEGGESVSAARGAEAWGCGSVADVTTAPCRGVMGAHCGLPGGQLWIRTKLTLVVMKINKGAGGHKGAWVLFTLKAS
jgi:hypothetical protein